MRFLALFAVLALSSSSFVSAVLEEEALWMVKCANHSMSVGVPAAGIPPHLPFVKISNIGSSISLLGLGDLNIGLYNSTWAGLPWYSGPEVSGQSNGQWVSYTYSITWPSFVIKGNFDWNITTSLFGKLAGQHAEFNIDLQNVTWSGVWNMTLPQKNGSSFTVPNLTEFVLHSKTQKIKTSLSGLGLINTPAKAALGVAVDQVFNHMPAPFAEALRTVRFNGHWLNQKDPSLLKALLGSCGLVV